MHRLVLINPGYIYDPQDTQHIRLSYAYVTNEELKAGLQILHERVLEAVVKRNKEKRFEAMIEIESINLFYSIGELKKIDGTWHLPVDNTFKDQTNSIIEYVMNDTSSIIHVSSAKVNPTSTNVIFSVNDI